MYQLKFIKSIPHQGNVVTFVFANPGINWVAGQYMGFIIPGISQKLEEYEHWFSISSAPYQSDIHITVRTSNSPFKRALMQLEPGQSIQGHTVDGNFAWPEADTDMPIFIAGGIGITPFISMLRQQQHLHQPLASTLFYFNRNQVIPFYDELESLSQQNPELTIHYLFDKPLSLDPIINLKPNLEKSTVFLAGPVPMVDRLGQALASRSIPIKQDWYFGYDVTNF